MAEDVAPAPALSCATPVVELVDPTPARCETTPVVDAPPVVVEYVQPVSMEQQPSRRRRVKGKRGGDEKAREGNSSSAASAPMDLSQVNEEQLTTAVAELRQREMMLQSLLEAEASRLGDLLVQEEQEEALRATRRTERKKR